MVGQAVGYVRVSSADQNPERQIEVLGECARVFTDRLSGSSRVKRAGLVELMRYVRTGDTVRVASTARRRRHSALGYQRPKEHH